MREIDRYKPNNAKARVEARDNGYIPIANCRVNGKTWLDKHDVAIIIREAADCLDTDSREAMYGLARNLERIEA